MNHQTFPKNPCSKEKVTTVRWSFETEECLLIVKRLCIKADQSWCLRYWMGLRTFVYQKQQCFVKSLEPCVRTNWFLPLVCGAFEAMLYTELRKTVTDVSRWKRRVEKDHKQRHWRRHSFGSQMRRGFSRCVTKSCRVKEKGLDNEAWSLFKTTGWRTIFQFFLSQHLCRLVSQCLYHFCVYSRIKIILYIKDPFNVKCPTFP